MKKIALISLLTCAVLFSTAQVNFVKNPSFEEYYNCPDDNNKLSYAKHWHSPVDTIGVHNFAPEYLNTCATLINVGVPENIGGFQYPRTGNAYIGGLWYYDNPPPAPPFVSPNWRDYAQGHLHQPLQAGKIYCISFWVIKAEMSGYAIDNIGAYLDNGNINKRSPAGDMITDVLPQVYSTSIIKDTMNWVQVEGSFVATGNETHITLGNFAKQADVDTESVPYYAFLEQFSYYLIDDVSVIPIDLPADAGEDNWVEMGKQVQIGRVGDTTAEGLDCKWYHKGVLIDSGAIISVNANAVKNAVDTYVVVQTVCGLVKTDTVTVKTAGLGVSEYGYGSVFSLYPNPSNGAITITSSIPPQRVINGTLYDLLGRVVHQEPLNFSNKEAVLKLNIPGGSYILELKDIDGHVQRERIVIE